MALEMLGPGEGFAAAVELADKAADGVAFQGGRAAGHGGWANGEQRSAGATIRYPRWTECGATQLGQADAAGFVLLAQQPRLDSIPTTQAPGTGSTDRTGE